MWFTWSFLIVYKTCWKSSFTCIICIRIIYIYRVFPTGGMGESPPPPHQSKISSSPSSPPNIYFLPTKSQFNPIEKIKTLFLAVVVAPVATIFALVFIPFWNREHANFDFNWWFSIHKMLFLALRNFQIVKITPAQVFTTWLKNYPAVFTTFWHKVSETPKILGKKEQ